MSERVAAFEELHHSLVGAELPLDLGDADDARRTRDELIAQINDYLLPRLRQLDAPSWPSSAARRERGSRP
ncbi:MAG: hypothetical protein GY713_02220 [Actinomycetia bacterium]|nr:hypothetical protein [Actinomycetes bacterium]